MTEQGAKELLAELRSTERDLESMGYALIAIKLGRIGVGLAAALAACAREAKLEEAKWWEHLVTDALPCPADCMYCARMAALERAVGEKASLDPQRGQHDS